MLTLEQITNAARIAAKEFPIKSVELFGSYAEGRAVSGATSICLWSSTPPPCRLLCFRSYGSCLRTF